MPAGEPARAGRRPRAGPAARRRACRPPAPRGWEGRTLTVDMLNRSDFDSGDDQDVVLLITIRSRHNNLPVYDELVREMDRLGWGAIDLQLRSRLRAQS